jgi:hemerythrin-like domain-containing protein
MGPTAVLRHEHELVCRALAGADALAEQARRSGSVDDAAVRDFIEFARFFTDGCHHAKEERLLFPRLRERGAAASAPVAAMLQEHEGGRERVRRLEAALDAAAAGDADAVARVAENLSAYAALLRAHIAKENNVLFPLADRLLTDDDQRDLDAAFELVEADETGPGEHERLAAIADRLGAIAEEAGRSVACD